MRQRLKERISCCLPGPWCDDEDFGLAAVMPLTASLSVEGQCGCFVIGLMAVVEPVKCFFVIVIDDVDGYEDEIDGNGYC